MKTLKKFMVVTLGMACLLPTASQVVSADIIDFNLHVTREEYSVSSGQVKKSDSEPAVANIMSGLGGGKKVRIRAWTVAENEPATELKVAVANGKHTLHYNDGYGTAGRYYYLNASKYGWLDSVIKGKFEP
ncbi:TPA: hypothetical protein TY296_000231 [Streptococcus suis]|nr:hypothetical protein [Streptococcus suis]